MNAKRKEGERTGTIIVRPPDGLFPTGLTTKGSAVSGPEGNCPHPLSVISRQLKKSVIIGSQGPCRSGEGGRSYWRRQFPVVFLEIKAVHQSTE